MEFLGVLAGLIKQYVLVATPFFVIHAIVGIFVYRSARAIHLETVALKKWNPDTAAESEITKMLGHFVRECQSLGPKGLLVPMTDFSDRIDSHVDGMIGELQDRVNLLLVVGIAGTIYGIFEFVSGSNIDLDATNTIVSAMVNSMAKAFPVGFVGLMLMLLGQLFLCAPLEERLRSATAAATSKAIAHRETVTQAETAFVEEVAAKVEAAMTPLGDIRTTLTDSVRPVVEELGQRLDSALELIRSQFDALDRRTEQFAASVDGLHEGVRGLREASSNLESLLSDAPAVLQNTLAVQASQQQAFESARTMVAEQLEGMASVTRQLAASADAVTHIPEEIARSASEAREQAMGVIAEVAGSARSELSGAGHSLATSWAASHSEIVSRAHQSLDQYLERVATDLEAVTSAQREALNGFANLANNAEALITEPLTHAIGEAREHARAALSDLHVQAQQVYPTLVTRMEELNNALAATLQEAQTTHERLAGFGDRTRTMPGSLDALRERVDALGTQLGGLGQELRAYQAALSQSAARLPKDGGNRQNTPPPSTPRPPRATPTPSPGRPPGVFARLLAFFGIG